MCRCLFCSCVDCYIVFVFRVVSLLFRFDFCLVLLFAGDTPDALFSTMWGFFFLFFFSLSPFPALVCVSFATPDKLGVVSRLSSSLMSVLCVPFFVLFFLSVASRPGWTASFAAHPRWCISRSRISCPVARARFAVAFSFSLRRCRWWFSFYAKVVRRVRARARVCGKGYLRRWY